MSIIDSGQGAPKLSEIAVDEAQALLATGASEDGQTVLTQIRKVLTDALQRSAGAVLLTSNSPFYSTPGSMTWTGTQISFGSQTNIVIKLLQNETGIVADLIATYGAANTPTAFNTIALADGEVLYVELDRANIPTLAFPLNTLTLQNGASGGSVVAGKTIKKAFAGPSLASSLSGVSGTLSIPLAINVSGHLWWIPHGIYWPPNTSSPLGAVVTSTTVPIGGIIPYHAFPDEFGTIINPYGYSKTKIISPGFQLCDGSVIIDPQSPLRNPTRNDDGTPTGSFNASKDRFTPNLNGDHTAWNSGATWNEGDYVINGGTRYVAIQLVPPGIAITNTLYWIPESTYSGNLLSSNPYNKYRKTTQNQAQNSYLRGNNKSFAATDASAYGGANTHQLSGSEIPAHDHSMQGHVHGNPDHTHIAPSHTHGVDSHVHSSGSLVALIAMTGNAIYTRMVAYAWTALNGITCASSVGIGAWGMSAAADTAGNTGAQTTTVGTDAGNSYTNTTGVFGGPPNTYGPDTANTGGASYSGLGSAHNNEPRNLKVIYLVRIY